jgi:hypothetical protein
LPASDIGGHNYFGYLEAGEVDSLHSEWASKGALIPEPPTDRPYGIFQTERRNDMVKVLVIGYAPDAVDFDDPAVPPGLDEASVAEGIARDVQVMQERGWEAMHFPIRPEDDLRQQLLDHLGAAHYDCIVVGAGVRMTTRHVAHFETVVNAIRLGAPDTPVAFNERPDGSAEAVERSLRQA